MKWYWKSEDIILTEADMRTAWLSEKESGNVLAETFEQFLKWMDGSEFIPVE